MRKSYDSSSAIYASVVTGSSGIYKLVLSNSTTADITAGRYVYDVELILADYDRKSTLWYCNGQSRSALKV